MWNSGLNVARSWFGPSEQPGDGTFGFHDLDSDDERQRSLLDDFVLVSGYDCGDAGRCQMGDTQFRMLEGETLLCKEDVEQLVDRQLGRLFVTNYRVVFVPLKKRQHALFVALGCIAQVDVHYSMMRILCKNVRLLEFVYSSDVSASSILMSSVMASGAQCQPLLVLRQCISDQMATPFALVAAIEGSYTPVAPIYGGIGAEMKRLGAGLHWRVSNVNAKYALCASYPATLCVPSCISDETLKVVASFRSNGRIPVCTWVDRGVALLRSSQPLTGIMRASCAEDEELLASVARASESGVLYIVDARAKLAAYANAAKGKGTEIVGNYGNCRLLFLNVDNIHAVRASHKALFDLMVGQCVSGQASSGWYAGVERTGWMDHVLSLLRGAQSVALLLRKQRSSVLIHCSDGWDRTAQLSSLAQLLVDPYYRTLEGMAVLIEKEWLSFGHQFALRCNSKSLAASYWNEHEVSPIFAQWLDCVFQVMSQFPRAFEFNDSLLIALLDHSYSNRFATFLENRECDRAAKFAGMPGLWQFLFDAENVGRFRNATYVAMTEKPLLLDLNSPAMLSIWKGLYCRYFVRGPSRRGTAISADADTDRLSSGASIALPPAAKADHYESAALPLESITIIDDYCPSALPNDIPVTMCEEQARDGSSAWRLATSINQYVQTWIA